MCDLVQLPFRSESPDQQLLADELLCVRRRLPDRVPLLAREWRLHGASGQGQLLHVLLRKRRDKITTPGLRKSEERGQTLLPNLKFLYL